MKLKGIFIISVMVTQWLFLNSAGGAVLVSNSLKDLEVCKGKLQLKLLRIWGGAGEEDAEKFFNTPISITTDLNHNVYICDQYNHCIKVFKRSGEYIRTVGSRGRGPGDLYSPSLIDLCPDGGLVAFESAGRRFQYFTPQGKSKRIFDSAVTIRWMGPTSKNQLAVYDHRKTFTSGRLITVCNDKGKEITHIGKYHDKTGDYYSSERLSFAMDSSDNIYAANSCTPVIRKYSPDGNLLRAITIEPPFEIPAVEVTLDPGGNEINISREIDNTKSVQVKKTKNGSVIRMVKAKDNKRVMIFKGIETDSQQRIYVVIKRRSLTEKESAATAVSGGANGLNRERVNFDIVENIDINRLLVFNAEGRIIAEAPMTTFCDDLHISGNRLFIADGVLNQRVLEYEMVIKQ